MKNNVLKILENVFEPMDIIKINDLLGLTSSKDLEDLISVINELENEYLIYRTKKEKYILLKNLPSLKIGKLFMTVKGNAYLVIPLGEDIKIDKNNLNGAIHDDIVLCETNNSGTKVLKIVKRNLDNLVGEIISTPKGLGIKLDDDKKNFEIILDKDSLINCVSGHKVLVKIIKEISKRKYKGTIIKIIGHITDPGVDILSIAYKYGINDEFNEEVMAEVEQIPTEVRESELINRKDLTNEEIFTIDGDDTKDIDDAISLKKEQDFYILGVHIADVSHYVLSNTSLGDEALNRGTSSYLADTVIPMLPRKLSNGICSLNPEVVRLTLSCEMKIDKTGKIIDSNIFESYIKSRKQMTYKKVNDILVRNICAEDYLPYKETLLNMNELAHILRQNKIKRGYIDFDLDEGKIIQDETGKCIGVEKRIREQGECLIEDFMIAANETVSSWISNLDLPFIYRVHDKPNADKIEQFLTLVKLLGYRLKSKSYDFSNFGIQRILKELHDKKEFEILSSLLLRSMKKAIYDTNNIGHFGLGSRDYTHFTSPIRRFPDLTVHRLLRTYLFEKDLSMETINKNKEDLTFIAEHSSEREQASVKAERDVFDMKAAEYMENHLNEEFSGIINSVMNYGFFVTLPNLIEGLVHVNALDDDYYIYVPEQLSMIGERTKKTYRVGDKIKVRVIRASKEDGTIDFEVVEERHGSKK